MRLLFGRQNHDQDVKMEDCTGAFPTIKVLEEQESNGTNRKRPALDMSPASAAAVETTLLNNVHVVTPNSCRQSNNQECVFFANTNLADESTQDDDDMDLLRASASSSSSLAVATAMTTLSSPVARNHIHRQKNRKRYNSYNNNTPFRRWSIDRFTPSSNNVPPSSACSTMTAGAATTMTNSKINKKNKKKGPLKNLHNIIKEWTIRRKKSQSYTEATEDDDDQSDVFDGLIGVDEECWAFKGSSVGNTALAHQEQPKIVFQQDMSQQQQQQLLFQDLKVMQDDSMTSSGNSI